MDGQLDLPGHDKDRVAQPGLEVICQGTQAWIPSWYLLGTTRSCGGARFWNAVTEDWMKVSMALCMII
jgi:hypothetical protein